MLCARLRDAGDWTPILMLTARSGPEQETRALDAGADDFLAKPFSFMVLLARLRALQRRGGHERPTVLEVGDLRLDPAAHQTWRGEQPIELTPRQFSLLEFLMRRAGEVTPKATILAHVWDFAFDGDPNIVEVYVRQLRQRIDEPFGRHSLQTVRLVGYRLVARLMRHLSLRTRATLVATLVTFLTLVVGSVVLVAVLEDRLTASADQLAQARVRDLLDVARTGDLPAVLRNVNDEAVAQVVAEDGAGPRRDREHRRAADRSRTSTRAATGGPARSGRRTTRRPRPTASGSAPAPGPAGG